MERGGSMLKKKRVFVNWKVLVGELPETEYFCFRPDVITVLSRLIRETDFCMVLYGPPLQQQKEQERVLQMLAGERVVFDEVVPYRPDMAIWLSRKYGNGLLDEDNSYVIGVEAEDSGIAECMGVKVILMNEERSSWMEVWRVLRAGSRKAKLCRKTTETEVSIEVDLNGGEAGRIKTGLSFFDHMLEQIARHGNVGLAIQVKGDLEVDEHHTVEDTGIVLGMCFREALGSKKGIARYGFSLPMDEAKAEVVLDFGGRAWLEWDVKLGREYAGDFPTDMLRHFFASFCQNCGCNLHVSGKGENTHHLVEAVFKAFGRCIGQAVKQIGEGIPSSKGIV